MESPTALVVFLRLPVRGKVKTRIAATMGKEKALEIYKYLYQNTLKAAADAKMSVYLFYEGGLPDSVLQDIRFFYHNQVKGGLDQKINQALSLVLRHHRKAIVIGSDCPELSATTIHMGAQSLNDFDIVLGPARDGGFYLFGCRKYHPELLNNIPWSTSGVSKAVIQNIEEAGLSYTQLAELPDIDTELDWINFNKERK